MEGRSSFARTKEIFHQGPIDSSRLGVSKCNDRGSDLAQAKLFSRRAECVLGIVSLGVDLTCNLAVGQHSGREGFRGPVGSALVEHGLVEDVVASKEVIRATSDRSASSHSGIGDGRAARGSPPRLPRRKGQVEIESRE